MVGRAALSESFVGPPEHLYARGWRLQGRPIAPAVSWGLSGRFSGPDSGELMPRLATSGAGQLYSDERSQVGPFCQASSSAK